MCAEEHTNHRATERFPLEAKIEFFVDADIIQATTIDVSQTGVSFNSPEPLPITMRINMGETHEDRQGRLVWARKGVEGQVCYGLEFDRDETIHPLELADAGLP